MTELESTPHLIAFQDQAIICIPSSFVKKIGLKDGDKLKLSIEKDSVKIRKAEGNGPQQGGSP